MSINLAQQVLEMAAAYRSEFVPGQYRTFVKKDDKGLASSFGRYVVGKTVDGEYGLFSIPSVSAMPSQIPNERVARLLGLKKKKLDDFSKVEQKVIQVLLDKGYVDITDIQRNTGKKSTYAGKEEVEEGIVKPFKGKVYHGTEDVFFFSNTYSTSDFGYGSHLQSLQGGDAFSVTPNIDVSKEFSTRSGMIIEYNANLTVYYAGREEDDLDEIDIPDKCDAVAIPHGTYEEEEFAIIQMDGSNLVEEAIYKVLPNNEWKRYTFSVDPIVFGEMDSYLIDYFADVYGNDIKDFFEWVKENELDYNNNQTFSEEEGGFYLKSSDNNLIAFLDPSTPAIFFYGLDSSETDWGINDRDNKFENAEELMKRIRGNE